MVGRKKLRDSGFINEISRYNDRDDRAHWFEIDGNYTLASSTYDERNAPGGYMGVMERASLSNPDAMIFFTQSPMRHEN